MLMRLTITGGNDAVDGSIKSARGQSCVITDYVASTGAVTCDFTRSLEHGYVLYGYDAATGGWLRELPDKTVVTTALKGTGVTADAAYTIYASWVPSDYKAPFYAVIGNVGTAVGEVIRVTAISVDGTQYKLTVNRGVAGTAIAELTHAESEARNAKSKITYSKAFVLADVVAAPTADTFIMVTDLSYNYVLPTGNISNWFAKIQKGGAATTEVVKVLKATATTWRLNASTVVNVQSMVLKVNADSDAYPTTQILIASGDQLRIGPSATGLTVTASADATYALPLWTVTLAAGSMTAAWPEDTEVTLIKRKNVPNPTMLKVVRAQVSLSMCESICSCMLSKFSHACLEAFRKFAGRLYKIVCMTCMRQFFFIVVDEDTSICYLHMHTCKNTCMRVAWWNVIRSTDGVCLDTK